MPDLWPDDIGTTEIRAPVTVLREQASLLGVKTQNIVTAFVESPAIDIPDLRIFTFSFYLRAPAIDFYKYELFKVSHRLELYPVLFLLDEDLLAEFYARGEQRDDIGAGNEEQLLEILSVIFKAGKTKAVISSLIAQSEGYQSVPPIPPPSQ